MMDALWAKSNPPESLERHMNQAGRVARFLLKEGALGSALSLLTRRLRLSEEQALSLVGYLTALHDIGKAHPAFQSRNEELSSPLRESGMFTNLDGRPKPFRHEKYTKKVMKRIWKGTALNEGFAEEFSALLALHHQGKCGDASTLPGPTCKAWQALQDELERRGRELFRCPLSELKTCEHWDAAAMTLLGVVILADWVASSIGVSGEAHEDDPKRLVEAYGLGARVPFPYKETFCELFPKFETTGLRELQKTCERLDKREARLCVIEAPMGEGKTEAALFMASHMIRSAGKSGFYVAMPTMATGNQMYCRVKELLAAHGAAVPRLLHGAAWAVKIAENPSVNLDNDDADAAKAWLQPLRFALLAQYGVGTVDQAMMGVMPVRYGVLRLLGLSGKVLIIDEIHAYDVYMSEIIKTLLSWCSVLEIPVVLLSATLPKQKRQDLIEAYGASSTDSLSDAYPLITMVDKGGTARETPVPDAHMRRSFHVRPREILGDVRATAEAVAAAAAQGGCICVMLNTVTRAQDVYKELDVYKKLHKNGFDGDLILFHARFPAGLRQKIEDRCVKLFGKGESGERPKSAILVCTQVVEQSLDLDFDYMISELAPIDLLLQRLGRLHRHDGIKRPDAYVSPITEILLGDPEDYKRLLPIYATQILRRTEKLLERNKVLHVPEKVRELIEYVYSTEQKDEDRDSEVYQKRFKEDAEKTSSHVSSLPKPCKDSSSFLNQSDLFEMKDDEDLEMVAKTRLAEASMRVALAPREQIDAALKAPHDKDAAQKILSQSVSIPCRKLQGLKEATKKGVTEGKGLLKGCWLLPSKDSSFSWEQGKIVYDSTLGVLVEHGDKDNKE